MLLLGPHHHVGYHQVKSHPGGAKERWPEQGIANHYEEVRHDLWIAAESVETGLVESLCILADRDNPPEPRHREVQANQAEDDECRRKDEGHAAEFDCTQLGVKVNVGRATVDEEDRRFEEAGAGGKPAIHLVVPSDHPKDPPSEDCNAQEGYNWNDRPHRISARE